MEKIVSLAMYVLWVLTIGMVIAATMNDFQYMDLNIFSGVLFFFACLNSYFVMSQHNK